VKDATGTQLKVLRREWLDLYGPETAARLVPDVRYALVRAGAVEFAYVDYDAYVRALSQIWDAGLVPQPLPRTLGTDLPKVAPNLRGVDADLADLVAADVRTARRFV
jgi:hypothetical protein